MGIFLQSPRYSFRWLIDDKRAVQNLKHRMFFGGTQAKTIMAYKIHLCAILAEFFLVNF